MMDCWSIKLQAFQRTLKEWVLSLHIVQATAYASSVPKQIHYMYVQLYRSAITNAYLQIINITFDVLTGKVRSKVADMSGYRLADEECFSKHSTVIWNHEKEKICKDVKTALVSRSTPIQILHDERGRSALKTDKLKIYIRERCPHRHRYRNVH